MILIFLAPALISLDDGTSHTIQSLSHSSAEYTELAHFKPIFQKSSSANTTLNKMSKFYLEDSVASWYTIKFDYPRFITHVILKEPATNDNAEMFISYRWTVAREMTIYNEQGEPKVKMCFFSLANIYLFEINIRNIRKKREIYSKLTIKAPK